MDVKKRGYLELDNWDNCAGQRYRERKGTEGTMKARKVSDMQRVLTEGMNEKTQSMVPNNIMSWYLK